MLPFVNAIVHLSYFIYLPHSVDISYAAPQTHGIVNVAL
jgi:hypothetical protein